MILIKALYPNPPGADTGREWITLQNNGEETASLVGWTLRDASGKSYVFHDGFILGKTEKQISNQESKISLSNKSDTVFLYDIHGKLVDSLVYASAVSEGAIVSHDGALHYEAQSSLQEQNLPDPEQLLANATTNSFWSAAIAVGIVFAGIAMFLSKKMAE